MYISQKYRLRKRKNENDVRESRAPDWLWLAMYARYGRVAVYFAQEPTARAKARAWSQDGLS